MLTDNIAGRAGPGHPRWAWALTLGMNELLVHLSGAAATATRAAVTTVLFHPDLAGTAGASDMEELLESWSGPLTGTAP